MQSFRPFKRGLQLNNTSDQGHGRSMPTFSGHPLPVLLLFGWPLGPYIHHRKAGEGLGRHQNIQSEKSYRVVEEVLDVGILMAR